MLVICLQNKNVYMYAYLHISKCIQYLFCVSLNMIFYRVKWSRLKCYHDNITAWIHVLLPGSGTSAGACDEDMFIRMFEDVTKVHVSCFLIDRNLHSVKLGLLPLSTMLKVTSARSYQCVCVCVCVCVRARVCVCVCIHNL